MRLDSWPISAQGGDEIAKLRDCQDPRDGSVLIRVRVRRRTARTEKHECRREIHDTFRSYWVENLVCKTLFASLFPAFNPPQRLRG